MKKSSSPSCADSIDEWCVLEILKFETAINRWSFNARCNRLCGLVFCLRKTRMLLHFDGIYFKAVVSSWERWLKTWTINAMVCDMQASLQFMQTSVIYVWIFKVLPCNIQIKEYWQIGLFCNEIWIGKLLALN